MASTMIMETEYNAESLGLNNDRLGGTLCMLSTGVGVSSA